MKLFKGTETPSDNERECCNADLDDPTAQIPPMENTPRLMLMKPKQKSTRVRIPFHDE